MNEMRKYRSLETWANAMRKDMKKALWHDWFCIAGHWYICEEYDHTGKYMRYTSITKGEHIDINTSNRYSDSWLSDMTYENYEADDYRFDWTYYIEVEELKKLKWKELNNVIVEIAKTNLRKIC